MTSELPSDDYKKVAEARYSLNIELLKSARAAQIEYGRWLTNTLWLMHSGAIVGLFSKIGTADHPPAYWSSVFWFVAGIVFAFMSAFSSWWNFTYSAKILENWADPKMLVDRGTWPQMAPALFKRVTITLYVAIGGGVASVGCLLGGSLTIWCLWK